MNDAPPVFTNAMLSASAATVSRINEESSARVALRHFKHPVTTINSTPQIAAIEIGASLNAAPQRYRP